MVTALFAIAIVSTLLAVHPFVTYPLSLWLLRAVRRAPGTKATPSPNALTFAACVCAYNEERVIEAKIRNLLELRERERGLSIHVYVDAAADRTAEILRTFADQIDLVVSPERHGKTYGMNLLSARAQADVLIFTDANVMLDLECVSDLRRHFSDANVGCVCGNLNYTNSGASVTASSGSLYWRFEEALKRLESDTGSMMGADGSIFAIRRELRRAPPDHIIDDMYVSLMTIVEGYRLVQAPDVRAFEESVTSSGEEFMRKVRIACQAFNVHRLLWPRLRRMDWLTRYKYLSHKYLRWLSIYFLGIAALSFIAAFLALGYTAFALSMIALAVGGWLLGTKWPIKPFVQIVDLLTALAG
ncbi:MAG TPA: glycosyltransferase, partial [Steroidobacteraceae bacterium]|nr:glycosyltransferase [Steroidobacteraceae bacterium]